MFLQCAQQLCLTGTMGMQILNFSIKQNRAKHYFFCSAFLQDFSLRLDRMSGDASNTWRGPAIKLKL